MTVREQKIDVLYDILAASEIYYGTKSKLEQTLNRLKAGGALTQADYDALAAGAREYKAYFIGVIARTPRVRVSFDRSPPTTSHSLAGSEELQALFSEDLGDL
jgi:hypothetical protein